MRSTRTRPDQGSLVAPAGGRAGPRGPEKLLAGVLAAHVVTLGLHGSAHKAEHVDLAAWQTIFVALIVVLAPLYGAWLHWRTRARAGLFVITGSMLAADVFAVMYHLVLSGDDNVRLHPVWHAAHPTTMGWVFATSAFAVILAETLGTATGLWCLMREARKVRDA